MKQETKESVKKYILIYTLGYLNAIETGCIEMNHQIFNDGGAKMYMQQPYFKMLTFTWLEENNFEQSFIDLIHLVMELEDVHSVVPQSFNDSLAKCKSLTIEELKKIPQYIDGFVFPSMALKCNFEL